MFKKLKINLPKSYVLYLLFIIIGILLAVPLFSTFYYAMVRTSTPEFCASCHEIHHAYDTWMTSSHHNNEKGVVADCMDCHIASPRDLFDFFYSKTLHGAKDVFLHFFKSEHNIEEMKKNAVLGIKNNQCLKCHRNLLYIPGNKKAYKAHKAILNPKHEGKKHRCLDCHKNLVHNDRELYFEDKFIKKKVYEGDLDEN
ncbi:MAG: NapC/NirT family cytochrome c [Pseudomonadota bacterium]